MAFLSLQIKPNDEWLTAVISPDSSVSIEIINSIFDIDAGGGFSYPFTLSVEANQHLFPTLTNNHGAHVYDLICHKPFRLYAGGVPLFHGIVDMDDEVEIETQDDGTHTVAINLASDNQELSALLEGVNCQDVPVKDRIPVGTEYKSLNISMKYKDVNLHNTFGRRIVSMSLPAHIFSTNKYRQDEVAGTGDWRNSTNVEEAYPAKAYCNARVCIQKREKDKDGNYQTLREYEVFDADRRNSGICFYLQYFLDCLFAYFNISYNNTELRKFEDMNRIAFFSTKCECDSRSLASVEVFTNGDSSNTLTVFQELGGATLTVPDKYTVTAFTSGWIKYANSRNFPNMEASSVIKDLQNAFGIRFVFNSYTQSCKAVFIKDIFYNTADLVVSSAIIHSEEQVDNSIQGVKMTFGRDSEGNTDYNYSPDKDNSGVIIRTGFSTIKIEKGLYDKATYYDKITGNMYRLKVDENATKEEELYPSLFEVGQFCDATLGDTTEENKTKEITASFSPIVCNIIEYEMEGDSADSSRGSRTGTGIRGTTTRDRTQAGTTVGGSQAPRTTSAIAGDAASEDCKYAVFVDVELTDPKITTIEVFFTEHALRGEYATQDRTEEATLSFASRQGYTSEYSKRQMDARMAMSMLKSVGSIIPSKKEEWQKQIQDYRASTPSYDEDPLAVYDAGYTLGVMRGPGNKSGSEIIQQDYDGNGNAYWAYVPKDYAFTADSIDHFGNIFDYNGTAAGGISLDGRTSLKLQGEKTKQKKNPKIKNDTVVVSTSKESAYWLSVLFPDSAIDLLSLKISFDYELYDRGWTEVGESGKVIPIYTYIQHAEWGGRDMYRLLSVVNADGVTQSKEGIATYGIPRSGELSDELSICIKESEEPITQKIVDDLKALVNLYYFPETAEPYILTDIPDVALIDSFYPINSTNAHRGLFHKFNYEYAYFLIHARIVRLTTTMSLAELHALDLTKWHTFGQYTGLIKQVSYDLDNERGLSDVTIELYYL